MAADVTSPLSSWSTTAASNAPAGTTAISTNLDDNLREIQKVVRYLASSSTIASAGTTDLSTIPETFVTVSGTTTITGFGTESAGIYKWIVFSGALTLTHNATSLILPAGANITTAAGDTALVLSLGSGNWRCLSYNKKSGLPVTVGTTINDLGDATAAGTVESAAYQQTWNWDFSGNSQTGFKLSGASGSARTGTYLLHVDTEDQNIGLLKFTANGGTDTIFDAPVGGNVTLGAAEDGTLYLQGFLRSSSSTGVGGPITITSGDGYSQAGGPITIQTGTNANSGGTRYKGGDLTLQTGTAAGSSGTAAAGGTVYVKLGEGTAATADGDFRVQVVSQDVFIVDGSEEHLYVSGAAAPTINTGGGTGATIAGKDNAFKVTMGTGSPTSVTVDFGTAWATAPVAVASTSKSGQTIYISSCTTTQIVVQASAGWAQNDILHVHCIGYA